MGYYRAGGFLDWLSTVIPKGLPAEPGAAGAAAGRALGADLYGAHWVQDPVLAKAKFGPESYVYVGSDVGGSYNPALERAVLSGGGNIPLASPVVIGGGVKWDTIEPGASPTIGSMPVTPGLARAHPRHSRRRTRRMSRRRRMRSR